MRTMNAIQHKTSHRWLTTRPSTGQHGESPHEAEAWASEFMSVAEIERFHLLEFAACWHVVQIIRPMPVTTGEM